MLFREAANGDANNSMYEHVVRFGLGGNSEEFQDHGWGVPEPGFVWTNGRHSKLLLPRPDVPGDFLLSFVAGPFTPHPGYFQRVTCSLNGVEISRFVIAKEGSFYSWVPSSLVSDSRPNMSLSFDIPDAGSPLDFGLSNGARKLGIMFRELAIRSISAPVSSDTEVRNAAQSTINLGTNCQFGFVQRNAGVEPLDLLRWATSPFDSLIHALENRFEQIGRIGSLRAVHVETSDRTEWVLYDEIYGFVFNHIDGRMSEDQVLKKEGARIRRLAEKLIDDLTAAEKLFLYQGGGLQTVEDAQRLSRALRKYNDKTCLLAVFGDAANPGRVDYAGPGLLAGYVEEIPPFPARTVSWDTWRRVVETAVAKWRSDGTR